MNYIFFDLEWNRLVHAVKRKCPDEIIQIGAVKLDKNMQIISEFNQLIKPVIYPKIEPTVSRITGLKHQKLKEEGIPFPRAIKEFRTFIGSDAVLLSWGTQDARILRENCLYYNPDAKLTYLKQFADGQKYITDLLAKNAGLGYQLSVKMAADLSQIPFDEEKLHNAHVDAQISALVFAKYFKASRLSPYIIDATRTDSFKEIPLTDLSDKLIDRKAFRMHCPDCGRFIRKKRGWSLHGTKFTAIHNCRKCKHQVICSLEISKYYGNFLKYKKHAKVLRLPEKKK